MKSIFMSWVDEHDHTIVWPSDLTPPRGIRNGERPLQIQRASSPYIGAAPKVSGLAVTQAAGGLEVWGDRTLLNNRQSGHEIEGYVSINGKRRSAFTSRNLFLIEGKLVDVGILYVRNS